LTIIAKIWDLALFRRLSHAGTSFALDVAFASDARRLVLFGASGAGKTQTVKMIAGIARPDRGHVKIAGRTLFDSTAGTDLSPQARTLAYVFQDYALFPHLTVRQNIAFARHRGLRNPAMRDGDAEVTRSIEAFHLGSVADHFPHQISGGQRQRTALARALVNKPTALILDEPFAALDRALRARLRDELADLQAELAIPMLVITHDDDDIRRLADDVVHLADGRVVAHGDTAQIALG
jgi:molybdate transport system ATP-binding protein